MKTDKNSQDGKATNESDKQLMGFQRLEILIALSNWKVAHQKATGVILIQWT